MTLYEVLTELGYTLRDFGTEFRTKPLYRESRNNTSLAINKATGHWRDYGTQQSGSVAELVALTLGRDNGSDWLKGKNVQIATSPQSEIKTIQTYNTEILASFTKDYTYWENRGLSSTTVALFHGGIVESGRMKGRFVFPIYNFDGRIIGFSGRDLTGQLAAKWKHMGPRNEWLYPLYWNKDIIRKKKSIVLIESIGDMLALWEAGVDNTMVLFGTGLGIPRLNILLRLDPDKIFIATNNDELREDGSSPGRDAAQQIEKVLLKHFDARQIEIALPPKKDFGEMNKEQIKAWYVRLFGPPEELKAPTRVNIKTGAPYDVYMGRKNVHYEVEASPFANPFIIDKHGTRDECIDKYEPYLRSSPHLIEQIKDLSGKVLACYCNDDERCHCDVVIKIFKELYEKK